MIRSKNDHTFAHRAHVGVEKLSVCRILKMYFCEMGLYVEKTTCTLEGEVVFHRKTKQIPIYHTQYCV